MTVEMHPAFLKGSVPLYVLKITKSGHSSGEELPLELCGCAVMVYSKLILLLFSQ